MKTADDDMLKTSANIKAIGLLMAKVILEGEEVELKLRSGIGPETSKRKYIFCLLTDD